MLNLTLTDSTTTTTGRTNHFTGQPLADAEPAGRSFADVLGEAANFGGEDVDAEPSAEVLSTEMDGDESLEEPIGGLVAWDAEEEAAPEMGHSVPDSSGPVMSSGMMQPRDNTSDDQGGVPRPDGTDPRNTATLDTEHHGSTINPESFTGRVSTRGYDSQAQVQFPIDPSKPRPVDGRIPEKPMQLGAEFVPPRPPVSPTIEGVVSKFRLDAAANATPDGPPSEVITANGRQPLPGATPLAEPASATLFDPPQSASAGSTAQGLSTVSPEQRQPLSTNTAHPAASGEHSDSLRAGHQVSFVNSDGRPLQPAPNGPPSNIADVVRPVPMSGETVNQAAPPTAQADLDGYERDPALRTIAAHSAHGEGAVSAGRLPNPGMLAAPQTQSGPRVNVSSDRQPATNSDNPADTFAAGRSEAAPLQASPLQTPRAAIAAATPTPNSAALSVSGSGELKTDRLASEVVPVAESRFVSDAFPTRASPDINAARPELPRHIATQLAEIAQRVETNKAVELTLNPVELGKVRMTLHSSEAGVQVQITAERSETLDLMRRNAEVLASEFFGIGFSSTEFSFSQGHSDGSSYAQVDAAPSSDLEEVSPAGPVPERTRINLSPVDRVDIRV